MYLSSDILQKIERNEWGKILLLEEANNQDVGLLAYPLSRNIQLWDIGLVYKRKEQAQGSILAAIIQNAPRTLKIFTLRVDSLDKFIPLVLALSRNTTLKTLHLHIRNPSSMELSVGEINGLVQAIENMELHILKLDGIALNDRGAESLAMSLAHRMVLTEFHLEEMRHMSLAGMDVIARTIAKHPNITFFKFTSHQITASQAEEMLNIIELEKNTNLTYINIRYADQKTEGDWDIVYSRQHDITLRNQELAKTAKQAPLPESLVTALSSSSGATSRHSHRREMAMQHIGDQAMAFQEYRHHIEQDSTLLDDYSAMYSFLDGSVQALKSVHSTLVPATNVTTTLVRMGDHMAATLIAGIDKTSKVIGLGGMTSVLAFVLNSINDHYLQTLAYRTSRLFSVAGHSGSYVTDALALILTMHQVSEIRAASDLAQKSIAERACLEVNHLYHTSCTLTEVMYKAKQDVQKILDFFNHDDTQENHLLRQWFPQLLEKFGILPAITLELTKQFFPTLIDSPIQQGRLTYDA